jgi:hypothetical protein
MTRDLVHTDVGPHPAGQAFRKEVDPLVAILSPVHFGIPLALAPRPGRCLLVVTKSDLLATREP